jgi:predicted flap endonuclease-1-like 5' DNA nuclease
MPTITDIEGIGDAIAETLRAAGIRTTEALLKMGGTSKERRQLAESTKFSEQRILEWVNRADLYRIKGIGSEYADLLEAAGVDTVLELARRDAENLFAKLSQTNAEKNLVNRMPGQDQVAGWIKQAKSLPRAVEY